jgi:hypothetical protein
MKIAYDQASYGMPQYILNLVPPSKVNCDLEFSSSIDILISSHLRWGTTDVKQIQQILNLYINAPFRVIIFMVSDYEGVLDVPSNVILFRTSMCKSLKKPNEYLLPYIWDMPDAPFSPLPLTEKPQVGFCGLVSQHRVRTLQTLYSAPNIETSFILRNQFMGGATEQAKQEFYINMMQNHFTVCNRGAGNFSIRFYQTLAAGRIPVLLDTDILLPDGAEECVILAQTNDEIVSKIMEFWKQGDIENRQQQCYQLWLKIKNTDLIQQVLQTKSEAVAWSKSP